MIGMIHPFCITWSYSLMKDTILRQRPFQLQPATRANTTTGHTPFGNIHVPVYTVFEALSEQQTNKA
jgi:hypothetical protein